MSLLLKLSRSFSVRVTVRLKKVTIPMSVKISQFDKCLFCNGQGRCRCLNCNGRGILMKNGKEYKCSSCCCLGNMLLLFRIWHISPNILD